MVVALFGGSEFIAWATVVSSLKPNSRPTRSELCLAIARDAVFVGVVLNFSINVLGFLVFVEISIFFDANVECEPVVAAPALEADFDFVLSLTDDRFTVCAV